MIVVMQNVPDHVAGFIARDKVTKEDYDKVLMPAIDASAKQFHRLHFLMVLETDIKNFTPGAWLDDALIGLKHLTKWHRMAFVTNQPGVKKFNDIFSIIVPGESKTFFHDQLEEAIQWVSE